MRIVFCWPEITGYMAACWRALAESRQHELLILAVQPGSLLAYSFDSNVMRGLTFIPLAPEELSDSERIARRVADFHPDVVYFSGWAYKGFTDLPFCPALTHARFIMGMDNQLANTWRQRLARIKIGRLLDRVDRVVVPGERAWQLAKYLKVPDAKIRRGLYGLDCRSFEGAYQRRLGNAGGWPRRFLFIGRYVEAKAIDILVDGYARYRASVPDPWPLACGGSGAFRTLLAAAAGVEDLGFVQPAELPSVMANHGVFVLASRVEPWGVVIAEACAAGLPVVCTEACGAAVEMVRSYYNGLTVPTEDAPALAAAMRWMHDHHDHLPGMGQCGQHFAAAYSAQAWAERWGHMLHELAGEHALSREGAVRH